MTGAALLASVVTASSAGARALEERCNIGEPGFVAGGYAVQANRWNSHGEICVTFGEGTSWTVSRSNLDWGTLQNGAPPGAYPNIGTAIAEERLPLRVDDPREVRTTWDITPAEGDFNASYDIWYHPDPAACRSTTPYIVANGGALEIMIWLTSPGIDPSPEWKLAEGVTVGGRTYDLYRFTGPTGQVGLIYDMREQTHRIEGFDLRPFGADAAARGFQSPQAYLCKVQAGFEVTRNGTGLRTNEFSLDVGPAAQTTAPATAEPRSAAASRRKEEEPAGPSRFLPLVLPVVIGIGAGAWWWRRAARR
ncbi:GH12 family glycosyl hydrolase domain-containing protein [Actinocorallia libanotica]|uniref:GH12 family glycosyl hydrolase domain-containing protein n=1 Tax=Actinocorallia libanotica TaxID=46162 RepID=UPI0031DF3100